MNGLFKRVGAVSPGRSVFDLSYEKTFTADMGYLYPIMCDEVVPGDLFEIGNEGGYKVPASRFPYDARK